MRGLSHYRLWRVLECLEIRSTIESQQINQENARYNKNTNSQYQVKVLLQVGFDALMLVGRLSVGKLQIGVREKYNVSQHNFTKRLNKHYIDWEMNWTSADCFTNVT